jgi:hypothetical protein
MLNTLLTFYHTIAAGLGWSRMQTRNLGDRIMSNAPSDLTRVTSVITPTVSRVLATVAVLHGLSCAKNLRRAILASNSTRAAYRRFGRMVRFNIVLLVVQAIWR